MKNNIHKGSAKLIKTINRDLVIQTIIKYGEISRSELAKQTELALPSIMRIVDPLVTRGLIIESRQAQSTGGRKPYMLKMNGQYMYIVGIEIAMISSVVLSDFNGKVIEAWSNDNLAYCSPEDLLDHILKIVKRWFVKYDIALNHVAGIGIGTPGFSFKHKQQIKGTILKGWESIEVMAWFKERINLPIYTDNVCRTRTLSEIWFGLGRNYKDFLFVYIDQGVGSAYVKNKLISKGHHLVAGEFGHTSIDYKGKPCYCGKNGCIEMYISAGSILNKINEINPYDLSSLAELNGQKNDDIKACIEEVALYMTYGISNLINLYNPEVLILGGMVPRVLPELVESVKNNIHPMIFNNNALETPIYISQVNNNLGSIALVIQEHIKAFDS